MIILVYYVLYFNSIIKHIDKTLIFYWIVISKKPCNKLIFKICIIVYLWYDYMTTIFYAGDSIYQ